MTNNDSPILPPGFTSCPPTSVREAEINFEFGVDRYGRIYPKHRIGSFHDGSDSLPVVPHLPSPFEGDFHIRGIRILTPSLHGVVQIERVSLGGIEVTAGAFDIAALHVPKGPLGRDDYVVVDWGRMTKKVWPEIYLRALRGTTVVGVSGGFLGFIVGEDSNP